MRTSPIVKLTHFDIHSATPFRLSPTTAVTDPQASKRRAPRQHLSDTQTTAEATHPGDTRGGSAPTGTSGGAAGKGGPRDATRANPRIISRLTEEQRVCRRDMLSGPTLTDAQSRLAPRPAKRRGCKTFAGTGPTTAGKDERKSTKQPGRSLDRRKTTAGIPAKYRAGAGPPRTARQNGHPPTDNRQTETNRPNRRRERRVYARPAETICTRCIGAKKMLACGIVGGYTQKSCGARDNRPENGNRHEDRTSNRDREHRPSHERCRRRQSHQPADKTPSTSAWSEDGADQMRSDRAEYG